MNNRKVSEDKFVQWLRNTVMQGSVCTGEFTRLHFDGTHYARGLTGGLLVLCVNKGKTPI